MSLSSMRFDLRTVTSSLATSNTSIAGSSVGRGGHFTGVGLGRLWVVSWSDREVLASVIALQRWGSAIISVAGGIKGLL